MFRKKELVEANLGYWEEKSYMMIIPRDIEGDLLKQALNELEKAKEIKLLSQNYKLEETTLYIKVLYQEEEYEIGIFVGGVSIPEYYLNGIFFTEEERKGILNAKKALTIFMKFNENVKKCYHLQLKLANIMVKDFIGVLDESAERMLAKRWVKMSAESNVLPSAKNLFTVQGVIGKHNKVWLHTHGLCRCGFTELEILDIDDANQQNYYNLLITYAMQLVDKNEKSDLHYKGAYIGQLINGYPVVATCVSWTKGILEYKKLGLGGLEDRKNSHNSKTSIVFLYTSENDENKHILSKVSIYDKLWGDNPLFFYSDEETRRMKDLAMEKFDYLKKAIKDKDNTILIKVGLYSEKEKRYEHIWFELLEFSKDKFKGRLTQEPYYFDDIHKGYENWYSKSDVTDWIVYTPKYSVSPDNAFLLDD